MSNKNETSEDIVDAKSAGDLVAQNTAVAVAEVQGAQLSFPFLRIAQGMSQWKTPQTKNGKPELGCWYIGKGADANFKIADGGKDDGIYGIILERVNGFKEDRPYTPGAGAPKRWIVGAMNDDGTRATEADCLAAAASAGYTLAPRPTGEVWSDSGRPKMRANLARFCYLMMLVPVPEDFESDEFRVYPIGDRLYTTARYEFDKQYYKQMDDILANIRSRCTYANRGNKDYKFSINGLVCHIFSFDSVSKDGVQFISHKFERAMRDGKPWEFTKEEREDFLQFIMSVQAGSASIDDVDTSEF